MAIKGFESVSETVSMKGVTEVSQGRGAGPVTKGSDCIRTRPPVPRFAHPHLSAGTPFFPAMGAVFMA